ncbi:TetR/AcrR family transcriptional regulator [Frankia sp. CNm7]|uniref:TetR/AcrR family transcriptional regulator n=1 Tax=Frankia nepalensis TaxID=1836974 RepID=A0A937RTX0_9ACTN|nr:TetR/AcrR family transcriptional regulator [Frankia nepalensis]MBL7499435.1 TetR/AcrR family transcriptional regulator [Frankia nepalensis]MBL7514910.1 TetR/AcrR family transcriptional regulator [Frankia nepalensis]MBL7524199.1 TetR/AcrR family transcriptional regulator [Frankia nepalensis]MBL7631841.1 TetR/AcrR family transcriptional regulator [Frankia nepalensis]
MARPPARPAGEKSTREQILDVAQELFATVGYEKTSLREIAERMNFSKAALYYHFASKDDLLLALHLRLHELGRDALAGLDLDALAGAAPDAASPGDWLRLFDEVIDLLLDNRILVVFHLRNHDALERLHDNEQHRRAHAATQDLEDRLRRLLADPRVPMARRLRLSAALGAVGAGLLMSAEALADVPTDELRAELRVIVRNLLGADGRSRPTAPNASTAPSAPMPALGRG